MSNEYPDLSDRMSITFVFSCYKVIGFPFMIQEQLITSSFGKISVGPFLFIYLQSSLLVTSWLTLQYLPTLTRKNLCVPATSTQAERVFSWMGWLLKKKALSGRRICQHATFLEGQSCARDCFCHCDVFSTIN